MICLRSVITSVLVRARRTFPPHVFSFFRQWIPVYVLFNGFMVVYQLTHDRMYLFDSVLYATDVERTFTGGNPQAIFAWNHPLWLPLGHVVYVAFGWFKFSGSGYETLQWINTFLGAMGISALYLFFSARTSRARAFVTASLVGASNVYWQRATGGEPYLGSAVFFLVFAMALTRHLESGSFRSLIEMGVSCVLAAGFHIVGAVLWPVFVFAAAFTGPVRTRSRRFAFSLAMVAAPAILYGRVQGWFDGGGLSKWWRWGSGLVNGVQDKDSGGFSFHLLQVVPKAAATAWYSLVATSADWNGVLFAFVLAVPVAVMVKEVWGLPPSEARIERRAFLMTFAPIAVILFFWQPGNPIYWATPAGLFICLASLGLFRRGRPRRWTGIASVILLTMVGARNLVVAELPNRRGLAAIPFVRLSLAAGAATPSNSIVLMSGNRYYLLKAYFPFFAGRQEISTDLVVANAQLTNENPVELLKGAVLTLFDRGVPLYATSDFFDSAGDFTAWGVTADQMASVWEGWKMLPVLSAEVEGPDMSLLWRDKMSTAGQNIFCETLARASLWQQAVWAQEQRFRLHPTGQNRLNLEGARRRLAEMPAAQTEGVSTEE